MTRTLFRRWPNLVIERKHSHHPSKTSIDIILLIKNIKFNSVRLGNAGPRSQSSKLSMRDASSDVDRLGVLALLSWEKLPRDRPKYGVVSVVGINKLDKLAVERDLDCREWDNCAPLRSIYACNQVQNILME